MKPLEYSEEELEARKRVENSPLRFFISHFAGSGDRMKLNLVPQEQEYHNTFEKHKRESE